MSVQHSSPTPQRQHIYEIDLMRAITVFSVVTLHSIATTQFLIKDISALYIANLAIHSLHYGREIFMFITGVVLTYAYFGKPFSAKKFWIKRFLLIFIPYVFWSIIYVKINHYSFGLGSYLSKLSFDILVGNASYQLYYILLALQFYMIFPIFLIFFKKVYRFPWITLSISLVIQLLMMYFDFYYIQTGLVKGKIFSDFILPYQNRIFITYQFFFIFGAFAAAYMKNGYSFLKNYGRYLPVILMSTLIFYALYYYYLLNNLHKNIFSATVVLQPSVVIYSAVIIVFYTWVSVIWAQRLRFYPLIKRISDTSFGIYFVHVFILIAVVKYALPFWEKSIAIPFSMIIVTIITFTLSVSLSSLLMKTPLLSWTIGRVSKK